MPRTLAPIVPVDTVVIHRSHSYGNTVRYDGEIPGVDGANGFRNLCEIAGETGWWFACVNPDDPTAYVFQRFAPQVAD